MAAILNLWCSLLFHAKLCLDIVTHAWAKNRHNIVILTKIGYGSPASLTWPSSASDYIPKNDVHLFLLLTHLRVLLYYLEPDVERQHLQN